MLDDRSDEELMELYVEGEARAFKVLMDRYSGPVFNFILRRCGGSRDVAEDVLQDAFVRVNYRFYSNTRPELDFVRSVIHGAIDILEIIGRALLS